MKNQKNGYPIHIIKHDKIKTICGINTNSNNISFVKIGFEHTVVNNKSFCNKCQKNIMEAV